MHNNRLSELLENKILLSKGNRIQRLIKLSFEILFAKILEIVALVFKRSIRIRKKTFWNEDMYIVLPELVSLNICKYGFYEENLTKMILKYMKHGMTFFDIGAHFGYFTLLGSYIVGDKGQVHAFEPTTITFKVLNLNVLEKSNVILNNLAVSSKSKTVLMNDYRMRYSAFNSIYCARLPNNIVSKIKPQKHEIQAISIDEYVKNNSLRPDFIKIDAESSEYEILLGMKNTIDNFHPLITIEVGDMDIEGVFKSKELIEFLKDMGYQPYEYADGEITPHIIKDESYSYDSILFLPEE